MMTFWSALNADKRRERGREKGRTWPGYMWICSLECTARTVRCSLISSSTGYRVVHAYDLRYCSVYRRLTPKGLSQTVMDLPCYRDRVLVRLSDTVCKHGSGHEVRYVSDRFLGEGKRTSVHISNKPTIMRCSNLSWG